MRHIRRLWLVTLTVLLVACHESAPVVSQTAPSPAAGFAPSRVPRVKHVFIVVLENESTAAALAQPFMRELAGRGAVLTNYHGIAHPSQPNYIALVSGSTQGVSGNLPASIDARHIGDLLEEHNATWKAYAEGYPGDCFLGRTHGSSRSGEYVRRHVPFLSFVNIQRNRERCIAHVVESAQLDRDIAAGTLPRFSFYTPDNLHNGHDSGVAAADRWLRAKFSPLLGDPRFSDGLLFIVTFDESAGRSRINPVATILIGPDVTAGATSDHRYDHYNLLRTIEEALGLGTLGQRDSTAEAIDGIWSPVH